MKSIQKLSHLYILILGPIILFLPSIIKNEVLFWGTASLQFIPWRALALDTLLKGSMPLWNPFNSMGAPLLANYQVAFFYPPNWIQLPFYYFGGVPGLATSFTVLVILHLVFASLGMAFFLKSNKVGDFGQVIGGLAFSLSGYLIARVSFFSIIWTVSWMPWIFYFISEITSQESYSLKNNANRKNYFGLIVCLWMLLLAGHAQSAWYIILLVLIWSVIKIIRSRLDKHQFLITGLFMIALIWAVSLSAIQLIPTYEYLTESQRAIALEKNYALNYSFWPWRLITFLMPFLFGSPANGTAWGYGNFWEDAVFVGVWPFLLFIYSIFNIFKKKTQNIELEIFSITAVLMGIILALGKNTLVFNFLFDHIPTFDIFQAPSRFMLWTIFGLAILAGKGGDALNNLQEIRIKKFLFIPISFIGVAIASIFSRDLIPYLPQTFWQSSLTFSIIGLIGGVVILIWKSSSNIRIGRIVKKIFLVIVLMDLILFGYGLNPTTSVDIFESKIMNAPNNSDGRVYISLSDEYDLKFNRFFRIQDFRMIEPWQDVNRANLPNINVLNGISAVNNFDPLIPSRFSYLMNELGKMPPDQLEKWLSHINVSAYYLMNINEENGIEIIKNNDNERFHWYNCVESSVSFNDSWIKINEQFLNSAHGKKYAIIENSVLNISSDCNSESIAAVTIIGESSNSIFLSVEAQGNGWLVISDTWYPGWKATVDNKNVKIYLADFILRGIQIPKGTHLVRLWYAPNSFYFGVGFTFLGIVALIVFSCLTFLSKKDLESL